MIALHQISKTYGSKCVLNPIDLQLNSSEHTVIMGANGAGKSTLLRIAAQGIEPSSGKVTYGITQQERHATELSKMRAFLSQHYSRDMNFSVFDLVLLGRQPFYHYKPSQLDNEIVIQALERFQLMNYAHASVNQLSGGELQRVHLARVYAQIIGNETTEKYFFMDEPANNLDIKFQMELFDLVDELLSKNTTVVSVLHDINMALGIADRLLFLKNGAIAHDVHPQDCDGSVLEDVYQIPFEQIGAMHFRPLRCVRNERHNQLNNKEIFSI
jgi:iron complex transport system ATP-binding protein